MSDEGRKAAANRGIPHPFPEWAEKAFRLWCRGQRNLTLIGRTVRPEKPVHRNVVKRNIEKFAAWVRAEAGAGLVDAYTEGIIRLEEIIAAAWISHATADNTNAAVGALRLAMDAGERLAAMRGVVTRRGAVVIEGELKVDDGGDQLKEAGATAEGRKLLADLAAELASRGEAEPGEPGEGAE